MIRYSIILIAIICIVCTTPLKASADWVEEMIESLKYYEAADPVLDAEHAAQKNEYYFLEVYGFAAIVPAIDYWIIEKCVKGNINIKGIEGTSDVLYGEEHVRLDDIAKNYAAIFNLRMHQLLVIDNRFPCFSKRIDPAGRFFQDRLFLEGKIEQFPNNATLYNDLGVFFYNEGKYDEAVRQFQTAIQFKPDSYMTHRNLAVAFQKLNKAKEAQEAFNNSLAQTHVPGWNYNWP